jgi:hypothetical protein
MIVSHRKVYEVLRQAGKRDGKTVRAHLCKLKFACVLNRGNPLAEGLPAPRAESAQGNIPCSLLLLTNGAR